MHSLLVETMPSGYFFSGVNTPASSSKQAAQAKPKGSLRLLCARPVHKKGRFYGYR